MAETRKYWIAVASANHVRRGQAGGFMQVSHGKLTPLKRISPGDGVVYYSPTETYGEKDRLQAFTAIGTVHEGEPYVGDMGGGFQPGRRDVDWAASRDAPIQPLLERLELTAGQKNWGGRFRFGLIGITQQDFDIIAEAMRP